MATSQVKRVIEPSAPMYTQGEIVNHSEFGALLVDGPGFDSYTFRATYLSGKLLGGIAFFRKESCRPFKGSVTITEG